MSLTPGTQLGGYEITAALGAGGMGEVYRARDSKLGRAVAVKIVREGLSDPDRIARFEREAKVLAALNHPHIAALYGMEVAEGRHFLVLELVEGETLADRIRRGPLPVGEALALATQIADALEAAHERGIVHRDLKPANVKVTPDDIVKVLDFGLAKAIAGEGPPGSNPADSPTISMMSSQLGVILGTAAYMSPEQAKGLPADHRADVFSFGVVLYEMLSGRQPFQGETAAEVLASVLIRDPDLSRLPPDLNPRLIDLVRRCLDKSPKRRWQAIGDVRAEIDAIAAAPRESPVAHAAASRPWWRRAIAPVVSAIVVGSIAAFAAWSLKPDPPLAVSRFSIPPPDGQSYYVGGRNAIAVSPDGQSIVFSVTGGLFERSLSSLEARVIAGSEGGVATAPAYSPDGRSIAYFNAADQTIRRIDLAGGTSVARSSVTLSSGGATYGFSWEHEGILLGQGSDGIARLSPNGGTPTQIIAVKPGESAASPSQLPNGEIMFVVAQGNAMDRWETAVIVAQRPGVTERRVVVGRGISPRYLPSGHLLYALGGTLMATVFDPDRAETVGEPVPVVQGVGRAAVGASGASIYAVSDSGLLAYAPGPAGFLSSQVEVTLTDRKGQSETLKIPAGGYETPRASPDGKMIALGASDGKEAMINVYSLSGTSSMRRLTYGGNNRYPVWSRDSRRVAFQSDREGDSGIFWQLADGTSGVERLTKPPAGVTHFPEGWSPVEDTLLFVEQKGNEFTLWTFSLKTRKTEPFGGVRSTTEISPSFSPDGKWVAYASNVTGGSNVYVQPYPATGAARQVFSSRSGGPHSPIWSHDGREILFNPGPQRFESVAFRTTPTVEFGPPVPVLRPFVTGPPQLRRQYDMAPSGKILGLTSPGVVGSNSPVPAIHVVLNWLEELKQRAPIR